MTTPVGGIRVRLLRDNTFNYVQDCLTSLGWFDSGRRHQAIEMVNKPLDWQDEIPMNTIAFVMHTDSDAELEMGSGLTEDTWTCYFDFYAESEDVGSDVINDIKDILRGKMASVGASRPGIHMMDYRMTTPVEFVFCDVENIVTDRAVGFNKPWTRFWFTCRFDLLDDYTDESDG